ncbi:hypothetical protein D3C74_49260 [compost metagenome]
MSRNSIIRKLTKKFNNWVETIEDEHIRNLVKERAFITGGAIVSLLQGEEPNDIDVYFVDLETVEKVTDYYVAQWNKTHKRPVERKTADGRVKVWIQSYGIASEADEDNHSKMTGEQIEEAKRNRKPYRPMFLSSNAISLSDDVQLITRFYGSPEQVHESFDFVHTKCYFVPKTKQLVLPAKSLEAIIMKTLTYDGSLYPIASILRAKKFIKRGWKINAGQYLKMIFQIKDLDLSNVRVLEDQLTGVDQFYFNMIIAMLQKHSNENPGVDVSNEYVVDVINKVFDGESEEV